MALERPAGETLDAEVGLAVVGCRHNLVYSFLVFAWSGMVYVCRLGRSVVVSWVKVGVLLPPAVEAIETLSFSSLSTVLL